MTCQEALLLLLRGNKLKRPMSQLGQKATSRDVRALPRRRAVDRIMRKLEEALTLADEIVLRPRS
jgi:hypothetical protein